MRAFQGDSFYWTRDVAGVELDELKPFFDGQGRDLPFRDPKLL